MIASYPLNLPLVSVGVKRISIQLTVKIQPHAELFICRVTIDLGRATYDATSGLKNLAQAHVTHPF
jgi:hypothetical protein